ncbi:hypothetical protein NQ315_010701, partial [Exocentrus adspersus]
MCLLRIQRFTAGKVCLGHKKNGFVECDNVCPRIDECHLVVEDDCCKRCKGCIYKGIYHPSHTEWTSPADPCKVLRCEANVVTESDLHCHTPCANPLPPEPGKCCPTCPECFINGQIASDDRDVISDDPCLKCRCSEGKMICSKKSLPRPAMRSCGPIPPTGRMLSQMQRNQGVDFHQGHVHPANVYELHVHERHVHLHEGVLSDPGLRSGAAETGSGELLQEVYYAAGGAFAMLLQRGVDGEQWKLDSCKSCKCQRGMPSCAITRCNTTCAAGTRLVSSSGECCPKCVEVEGACMVFGDPHYKSFDGKMFSFKGVGRYQLTADCKNNSFSVKVANTNRLSSTSTKRVAVRYGDVRINLQQRGRIKYNGKQIKAPFLVKDKFQIQKVRDSTELTLDNGVKLFWNGKSFLEVTVPAAFKNKLCGLCGNFNSNVQDDLKTKGGRVVTDKEILSFGTSWCYFNNEPFTACDSKLNYSKYYRACKMDMCHCPNGKCYCESLMAYARECQRLGVKLLNWQKHSYCDSNSLKRPMNISQKSHKSNKYNALFRHIPRKFNKTRGSIDPIPL